MPSKTIKTAAEWALLEEEAMSRSPFIGSSQKAYIDQMEAAIKAEQEINREYGLDSEDEETTDLELDSEDDYEADEDNDEADEDSDEADEDSKEADEAGESSSDEAQPLANLTPAQLRERASFPFKTLPPVKGTLLATDFSAETADEEAEYMSLNSDISEIQEEIDNCDVHLTYWVCTCHIGDPAVCDVHRLDKRCTCSLGADNEEENEEDAVEVMMDVDWPNKPQLPTYLQDERYYTRSHVVDG